MQESSTSDDVTGVRPARQNDLPHLVQMLARAFESDPAFVYVIGSDRPDQRYMRALFRILVATLFSKGRCVMLANGGGAALWGDPPGKIVTTTREDLVTAVRSIVTFGPGRFARFAALQSIVGRVHPDRSHASLVCIGVDPALQGQGFGGVLLNERLAVLDRTGCPAYLETATESNLGFYERFGFRITGEHKVPKGRFTIWYMWRDPKPQA